MIQLYASRVIYDTPRRLKTPGADYVEQALAIRAATPAAMANAPGVFAAEKRSATESYDAPAIVAWSAASSTNSTGHWFRSRVAANSRLTATGITVADALWV